MNSKEKIKEVIDRYEKFHRDKGFIDWRGIRIKLNEALAEAEKDFADLIKMDISLFEDARDILFNLREQGVGTWDIEKIFDERIRQLSENHSQPQ